ncbi:CubicO group peptidase (beta-lactamase class C family) [Nocardioides zeae]|uniref:CubicO group peptidase (Beta-lactamase class C family) n=1 Tax=Nocardioides zeae TaxID=1457234 RepID=A0ACC6IMC7_9ACTN|nr:serine hydrolase [Nocardioides zeae]MDR6173841.1 CubicO group peptidase (beta-lactamase class C family) [Nocardioides zeae]MDR6211871.1 CubicO group peptidase (beta-lactamase class C family) [Nocardioides zeae]
MSHAQQLLDLVVRAAEEDGFGAHAAHVLVGDETARHLWAEDVRRDVHSAAKAVCVLAAGIAHDEGVFDVDAPVARWFPGHPVGAGVEAVTTRHLLGMTSGIDLPWSETLLTDWPDLALELLSRPSAGRVFQYSNASTYTAMRALGTVVGDVAAWLGPRLFEPLGIDAPPWDRCPQGWVAAGGGLHLTVDELARIGRLIRDDGRWEGTRLVSARWPRAMRTPWVEREAHPSYARYSLGAWGGPGDAWRLHGAHGQLVILRGAVVVTLTAHDHAGADRMAERVVEACRAAPG